LERTSICVKCRITYLVYPYLSLRRKLHTTLAIVLFFFHVFRDRTPYFLFLPIAFGGLLANFMSIETQQKINALTDSFVLNELQ
jgi:Na+-transporting methylmalonyl-CoA/oxaloacetate decarboxylase beta subunit